MILHEMAQYLHNQSILDYDTTGITGHTFISVLPSSPDIAVALYARGGSPSDSKLGYQAPSIQIIVRGGQDPREGYLLADSIYHEVHGFRNNSFIPGGRWIVSCLGAQSGPIHLGRDTNGRHEYSLNFNLDIK